MGKLAQLTDKQLIEAMRDGDQRAVLEIYNRYFEMVYFVAIKRLDNPLDAEECVQDVMFQLWRYRNKLTLQYETLSYYLAVMVKNRVFKIMERNHLERERIAGLELENNFSPSADSELIAKEVKAKFDAAVQELPAQCRLVFKMNIEEGLTTKQIASELGIAENTVKTHLKKAKRDIRGNFEVLSPVLFQCFVEAYLHSGPHHLPFL